MYVYELRLRHVHAKLNTSRKVVGATRGINYTETQAWTSVSLNGKSITLKVHVHARILSQPILWVIHTNKCGSIQLLGQCIVPYEIYHPYSLPSVFHVILCLLCIEMKIFHV